MSRIGANNPQRSEQTEIDSTLFEDSFEDMSREDIQRLYNVFGSYSPSTVEYCDCGCISDEDLRLLASKPLRELGEKELNKFFHKSMTTWGDVSQFKHFLPRILELHNTQRGEGLIDLLSIISKLEHAEWKGWPSEELDALNTFFKSDWQDYVCGRQSSVYVDSIDYYAKLLLTMELVEIWDFRASDFGLKNLVVFLYFHFHTVRKSRDKQLQEFVTHLLDKIENENIVALLEVEFFRLVGDPDSVYSTQVSAVAHMLSIVLKDR